MAQGRRQAGKSGFVDTQRARQRMGAQLGDGVLAADDQAGLRPAQQLVAAESHQRRARLHAVLHARFVGEAKGRCVQ